MSGIDGVMTKVVNIQSSSICNGACKCCSYPYESHDNTHMSDAVWQKLCSDFIDMKSKKCTYTIASHTIAYSNMAFHFGYYDEPLCDPQLLQRIDDLNRIGNAGILIVTNASLLTPGMLNKLIKAGVTEFIFSMLSGTKDDFELLTGLSFDTVYKNISHAVNVLTKKGIPFKISSALASYDEKAAFGSLFSEEIIKNNFIFVLRDNRVLSYKTEQIEWKDCCFHMQTGKNSNFGCDIGIHRIVVLSTGDVLLCPIDSAKTPIGNIMTKHFSAIIDKQLRIVMNRMNVEPACCQRCYL